MSVGHLYAHVLVPGAIFSPLKGPLADAGFVGSGELMIGFIYEAAKSANGDAVTVGAGLNKWSVVDLEDSAQCSPASHRVTDDDAPTAADLFMIIFRQILAGEIPAHGVEGYFIAENGAFQLKEATERATKAIFGRVGAHRPFAPQEQQAVYNDFVGDYLQGNHRCVLKSSPSW